MDNENVVPTHNETILLLGKMKCTGKWMKLENILLSEVTQTQMGKHMLLLTCGS